MNAKKRKGTRNLRWTRYISLMLSAVLVIGIMSIRYDFVRADIDAEKGQKSFFAEASQMQGVYYRTQVQEIGWQEYVGNGETSGTSGQSKRLEAIQIKLENTPGGIEYRTHVQDAGWQDWSADDAVSGTVGMSKRLEAIEIRLTGEAEADYDIYYRVHAQDIGWMGWAQNGGTAGTAGHSCRLEAIEVRLVEKGEAAPGVTDGCFLDRYASAIAVHYRTHVQDVGWQEYVENGAVSGTSGQSKRLEGIQIRLQNVVGGIEYSTHIQDIGWQGFVGNDAVSGTSGQSKRLEAIKIQLTGAASEAYDIYYRVHAQNFGWLGWTKNGASAGTAGYSYRLEAIEIRLVEKGAQAPGDTTYAFIENINPSPTPDPNATPTPTPDPNATPTPTPGPTVIFSASEATAIAKSVVTSVRSANGLTTNYASVLDTRCYLSASRYVISHSIPNGTLESCGGIVKSGDQWTAWFDVFDSSEEAVRFLAEFLIVEHVPEMATSAEFTEFGVGVAKNVWLDPWGGTRIEYYIYISCTDPAGLAYQIEQGWYD